MVLEAEFTQAPLRSLLGCPQAPEAKQVPQAGLCRRGSGDPRLRAREGSLQTPPAPSVGEKGKESRIRPPRSCHVCCWMPRSWFRVQTEDIFIELMGKSLPKKARDPGLIRTVAGADRSPPGLTLGCLDSVSQPGSGGPPCSQHVGRSEGEKIRHLGSSASPHPHRVPSTAIERRSFPSWSAP